MQLFTIDFPHKLLLRDRTVVEIQRDFEMLYSQSRVLRVMRHRMHSDQIKELVERMEVARREFEVSLMMHFLGCTN